MAVSKEVVSTTEDMELHSLRQQLCQALVKSMESGGLEDILGEWSSSIDVAEANDAVPTTDDIAIESLRQQLRQALEESMESGELEAIFDKWSSSEDVANAADVLVDEAAAVAVSHGNAGTADSTDSDEVQNSTSVDTEADALRRRMCAALEEAMESGLLENVLQEPMQATTVLRNDVEVEGLRYRMRQAFEESLESGALEGILSENMGVSLDNKAHFHEADAYLKSDEVPVEGEGNDETNVYNIRLALANLLANSCESGELEQALSNVSKASGQEEGLFERAANALAGLTEAARTEAATRIQQKWRQTQYQKVDLEGQTLLAAPLPKAPSNSSSSGGSCSFLGRRRLFGLPVEVPPPVAPSSEKPARRCPRRSHIAAAATSAVVTPPTGAPTGFRRSSATTVRPSSTVEEAKSQQQLTALELDLGSCQVPDNVQDGPLGAMTKRITGSGLLPILPLQGSAMSDSFAWTRSLSDIATPRTVQKSIDVQAMNKYNPCSTVQLAACAPTSA
jgi:hypothetical protein